MKSKPGEKKIYSFYTLKWQQGYSTSHLMKHINQRHAADLMYDKESASEAQSPTQQRKITDSRVPGMSKTHRDALTKDLVQNLVFDLGYWRDNSTSSLLQPLLPLVASVSAVPATEAICERLFKAGGQVLTSARLRLLGSRVEDVLMTNFYSQLADAARSARM